MAAQKFANNASALLAASIDDNDLTIQLDGGYGVLFPSPGVGEYFLATLENADGDIEVVKVTTRATDLLTVAPGGRGLEGTSAQSWTNGLARVEVRLTKGTLESFLQREGDTMDGDLDMQDNEIKDVNVTGESTFEGVEVVNTPLRGAAGDDSNEISVPADGTRATAGGEKIVVEGDSALIRAAAFVAGMGMLWYGAAVDCPDGWHICDGTGGTPDMRNLVPIGAGDTYALGDTGGAATASGSTSSAGGHTPTGTVGGHTLTEAEMPAHTHKTAIDATGGDGVADVSASNSMYKQAGSGDDEYRLRGAAGSPTLSPTSSAGSGGEHTHPLSLDAVGSHTHTVTSVSVLQPYRAWHYIMYVG